MLVDKIERAQIVASGRAARRREREIDTVLLPPAPLAQPARDAGPGIGLDRQHELMPPVLRSFVRRCPAPDEGHLFYLSIGASLSLPFAVRVTEMSSACGLCPAT